MPRRPALRTGSGSAQKAPEVTHLRAVLRSAGLAPPQVTARGWASEMLGRVPATVTRAWKNCGMNSLLFYDYVDDILERRAPFRQAHLALAGQFHEQGVLLMAGALTAPVDGAVFVFATDDRSIVKDFVANDPYVREGLVTAWRIRSWNVVLH